jgi:hypothetical protein
VADPGITDPRLLKESQEPWASEGIFGYPQLGQRQNPATRLGLADPELGKRFLLETAPTRWEGVYDKDTDRPSRHATLRAGLSEERATEDPISIRELIDEHYYGGATSFLPAKDKEAIVYADYGDSPYDKKIAWQLSRAAHETLHDVLEDPEMKETRTVDEETLVRLIDWVSTDSPTVKRKSETWIEDNWKMGNGGPPTWMAINLRPGSGGRNNLDRFFKIANRKLEEQGRPTVDTDWIDEIISNRFASGEIVDWDVPMRDETTRKLSSWFPTPEQVEE